MSRGQANFIDVSASADFLAPGAIETNRYQTEILDRLRRRFPLGQRITLVPATGQPSRYFEQIALPSSNFTDPRRLNTAPSQPSRIEKTVLLKALMTQINFGIFDIEVNQQQNQYAYLESKDLTDSVDSVLRAHDIALWTGNDTSLTIPTSNQYYGISGQIVNASNSTPVGSQPTALSIPASGSLVDGIKRQTARMAANKIFEVRPSAFYANPLALDLIDQEAKTLQLYFNKVQILPGVIVQGIPTQMGVLPFIADPAIDVYGPAGGYPGDPNSLYTGFILSEDLIEYHWLTNPLPRVFQMGLTQNLASSYVVLKFGGVVAKGSSWGHSCVTFQR